MKKDQWKKMDKRQLFDDISENQRKSIIALCAKSIVQRMTDDNEALEANKDGVKKFLYKSGMARGIDLNIVMQQIALAELVGSYLIDSRDKFVNLQSYMREEELLKDMADIGVIENADYEKIKPKQEPTQNVQEQGETRRVAIEGQFQIPQAQETSEQAEQKLQIQMVQSPIEPAKPNESNIIQVLAEDDMGESIELTEADMGENKELAIPQQPIEDLSVLNNPDLLVTDKTTGKKDIKYGRYSEERRHTNVFDYQGREVWLTKVGRMMYKNVFMTGMYVDEYLVQTPEDSMEVFTDSLDVDKIENDEQYRRVFFEQLTTHDNLHLLNSNGYIGDIVTTGDKTDKYKINYSEEIYSAVTELKNRLEEKKRREEADKDDDR